MTRVFRALFGAACLWAPLSSAASADVVADDAALLERLGCGRAAEAVASPEAPRLDILVVGSSSTAGVGAKGRAYPARLAAYLQARLGDGRRVRVTPRGVGGERAAGALARLEREIDAVKPNLLIWQVGTNDAVGRVDPTTLERQIRDGVAAARRRGLEVVLVDPQYYPKIAQDSLYAATVERIAQVAKALGAPLIRRYARMKQAEAIGEDALPRLLAKDRFHMSPVGHDCLARDLAQAILPERVAGDDAL